MSRCLGFAFARRVAYGACAALAACGGGSRGDMGGPPDGMPDGPSGKTIVLRLASTDDLRLIAFRDGPTAPWQTPAATAPGRYKFVAHGPYTVLDTCAISGTGTATTQELSRTLDDPADVQMSCPVIETGPLPVPPSHVTGSMSPSGSITVGPRGAQVPASGQFDVAVDDGTYDVIARTPAPVAADDRIAIRRNLTVAGNTAVTPPIDVAAEGTASVFLPLTVVDADAGESLEMRGQLDTHTASTEAAYPGIDGVHVLPAAALGPDDRQSISVAATTSGGSTFSTRVVFRGYSAGTSLNFALPPAPALQYIATGGQIAATWTALPPFDSLELSTSQQGAAHTTDFVEHFVELSPSYVAATAATRAAFDVDVPGFDPAWRIDTTRAWLRSVEVTRNDGDSFLVFLGFEDVTP